jgi:transcriptional regulator with XRE-family HTH domain
MGERAKRHKTPGFTRRIVADNVAELLKKHYAGKRNITQMQRAFCAESGVNFSTVQRVCSEKVGASIDTLEEIAAFFELSAYQLVLPGLDVSNPQVAKGATKNEQALYARWRKEKTGTIPAVPASVKADPKRVTTS